MEPHQARHRSQSAAAPRRKAAAKDRSTTRRYQAHATVDTVILQGTKCLLYYRLVSKAANISLLEIRAAIQIAREDNAGGDDAELIRTAARLLGFRRVGSDL